MVISTGFQQLVAEFYEAAFEPQRWEQAFASLCQLTRSTSTVLTTSNTDLQTLSRPYIYNMSTAAWEFYFSELLEICPRVRYARQAKPEEVFSDYHHTSEDAMDSSEFYNRLEQHWGTRYYMGRLLPVSDYAVAQLSLHRKAEDGHYQQKEMQQLEKLAPHILHALQLSTKFSAGDCLASVSGKSRTVHNRIIVLDSNGVPIHITDQAKKIIQSADGLGVEAGALVTGYGPDQAKLEKLVTSAIQRSTTIGLSPDRMMPLHRKSGRRPYNVLVSPLYRRDNLHPILDAAAAVFVTDPEQLVLPGMHYLNDLYSFTPKESSLVAAFIKSGSLPKSTTQLGISKNTARAHLQNIFKKTATTSQAELLKLVLSS